MPDADDIRTEYSALTHYYSNVITFRFTTLGFFLATVALIVGGENESWERFALLLTITVGLWIVEFRNRTIYKALVNRGMEIERKEWRNIGELTYSALYCRLQKEEPTLDIDPSPCEKPPFESAKFFTKEIQSREWLTHSQGVDIIFLGVLIYSAIKLIFGLMTLVHNAIVMF